VTSAREPAAEGRPPQRGWVALAFAVAALAASWNPVAAPFGLFVGVAATVLAVKALRRCGSRRAVPAAAFGMAVLAAIASVTVLALTAGAIGVDLPGQPVVKGRTNAELEEVLAGARERTRVPRQRAAGELGKLTRPAPDGGEPRGALPGRPSAPSQPDGSAPQPVPGLTAP
jgi:hypothetical protein